MSKIHESGRSMIEMLGVLTIIGVLSVGGISGFSKAMEKHKINLATDQIAMLATRTRMFFYAEDKYDGLDNNLAWATGIISEEYGTSSTDHRNTFGAGVNLRDSKRQDDDPVNLGNRAFTVRYDGLDRKACVDLATNDWGAYTDAGVIALTAGLTSTVTVLDADDSAFDTIYISSDDSKCKGIENGIVCRGAKNNGLPMNLVTAAALCGNCSNSGNCSVLFKFY